MLHKLMFGLSDEAVNHDEQRDPEVATHKFHTY